MLTVEDVANRWPCYDEHDRRDNKREFRDRYQPSGTR